MLWLVHSFKKLLKFHPFWESEKFNTFLFIFLFPYSHQHPKVRVEAREPVKEIDYQIQLRIIEARQLSGMQLDPVCTVSIANQKKHTAVKEQTNTPFWDEFFVFDFKMPAPVLFDKIINFQVFTGRNLVSHGILIGSFKVGFLFGILWLGCVVLLILLKQILFENNSNNFFILSAWYRDSLRTARSSFCTTLGCFDRSWWNSWCFWCWCEGKLDLILIYFLKYSIWSFITFPIPVCKFLSLLIAKFLKQVLYI